MRVRCPGGAARSAWGVRPGGACQGPWRGAQQRRTFLVGLVAHSWERKGWVPGVRTGAFGLGWVAKKKKISGVRSGPCGIPTPKGGPKNKVCRCGAPEGCAGRLGRAPKGGGGIRGAPERGATVLPFLGLLGPRFVGRKKVDFRGALWCLRVSNPKIGFQEQGLRLRRPGGGARGAWGVRPRGGVAGGARGGGAAVLAFLGLLRAHFAGQKKVDFRGALWPLRGSGPQRGLKEQGLRLRCPRGLRGAPGVCAQGGGLPGGPGGGVQQCWPFWAF